MSTDTAEPPPDSAAVSDKSTSNRSTPKDTVWAWLIALSATTTIMFTIGIRESFGIIQAELLHVFESDVVESGLIYSAIGASFCISSLLMVALGDILQEQALLAAVGLVASLGLIGSSFATRMFHVALSFGACYGFAIAVVLAANLSLLVKYFDRRLALATSIVLSGGSVGNFILPPFMTYLLESYSYRGTLLILGGLTLNICTGAFLIRALESHVRLRQPAVMATRFSPTDEDKHKDATVSLAKVGSVNFNTDRETVTVRQTIRIRRRETSSVRDIFIKPGVVLRSRSLTDIFAIKLLQKPLFLCIMLNNICLMPNMLLAVTYLPSYSKQLAFSDYATAMFISIYGVADLSSHVLFGLIGDCGKIERYKIAMVCVGLCGIAACLAQFATSAWGQIILCILLGQGSAVYYASRSIILVDLFGSDVLSKSLGLSLFLQGTAYFFGGPLVGWLRDETGGYQVPFIVLGSGTVFGSAILLGIAIQRRIHKTANLAMDDCGR